MQGPLRAFVCDTGARRVQLGRCNHVILFSQAPGLTTNDMRHRRSNVDPVDLGKWLLSDILRQLPSRLVRQLVQTMQLIDARTSCRWIWESGCASIFCARSTRSASLSSISFSFVGYLGARSTVRDLFNGPRASDRGAVGSSASGLGAGWHG